MAHIIEGIRQVDEAELRKIIDEDGRKVKVIDVREPEEYVAGHIPGVPLIPMHTIPAKMAELDKDEEYIFVCRSGRRSHEVAKFLKRQGFEKVTNFYGGMLTWSGDIRQGMDE
jgi:rhodanese-related sulfurtransferase